LVRTSDAVLPRGSSRIGKRDTDWTSPGRAHRPPWLARRRLCTETMGPFNRHLPGDLGGERSHLSNNKDRLDSARSADGAWAVQFVSELVWVGIASLHAVCNKIITKSHASD